MEAGLERASTSTGPELEAPSCEDEIELTPWLPRLIEQASAVRAGDNAEAVHQLRVAVAHLGVWITLAGWHILADDLRWLRRGAAELRDLDVHLAHHPPPAVEARLRDERVGARRALLEALDHPRFAALVFALGTLPGVPRRRALRRAAKLARAALRSGDRALDAPKDLTLLHDLRRRVRRVRFAWEWLGSCPAVVPELQDALGQVGDRLAALRALGGEDDDYRDRLEREARRHARRARHVWRGAVTTLEELAS